MTTTQTAQQERQSVIVRSAIWIAIGTLLLAAVVLVVWVLVGPAGDIIGKAFITVLLLGLFAGAILLEASLAPRREQWLTLAGIIVWALCLGAGLLKIWMIEPEGWWGWSGTRFFEFLSICLLLHGALLHLRLTWRAHLRFVTVFTRILALLTSVFVVALVGLSVFWLAFPRTFVFDELYGRIVVSLAILAVVGTAVLPLVSALFAPKQPRPMSVRPGWPTFADGRTPLPALPDGTPDWAAAGGTPAGTPALGHGPVAPPAAADYAAVPPPVAPDYANVPAPGAPYAPVAVPPVPDLPFGVPAVPDQLQHPGGNGPQPR